MLQKIISDAGYTVISLEDRQCLLDTVENLQLQRDRYRELWRNRVDQEAGIQVETLIVELEKATQENRRLDRELYQLKLRQEVSTPRQPLAMRVKPPKRARG